MVKETIYEEHKATEIYIQQSEIKSIKKTHTQQTGLRIYYSGLIGVAGAIGPHDEIELEKKAMSMLQNKIPYLPDPTEEQQIYLIYNYDVAHGTDFIADMESLIQSLRQEFSDFSFNNLIQLKDQIYKIQNNAGLFLYYQDHFLDLKLSFNHTNSKDETDGLLICFGRRYDYNIFLKYCREKLLSFKKKINFPKQDTLPFIFPSNNRFIFSQIIHDLNGVNVVKGTSRWSNSMEQIKLHPDFTFMQSHHSENLLCPFFDSEGTAHMENDYRFPLIERGKVINAYTDKKTAMEYNMPHTGSAVSNHDEIPHLGFLNFEVQAGTKTTKELLEGKHGILVESISDGNFSSTGDFTCIVNKSYLTDGETLLGSLPSLMLKSSSDVMFGSDFIGVSKDPIYPLAQEHAILMNFGFSRV